MHNDLKREWLCVIDDELRRDRPHGTYGMDCGVAYSCSYLVNLSKETLTETEEAVLCRGLNFGIPPACKPEEIFAEFELCWGQLEKETPVSTEKLKECKATMAGMAQKYTNMKIDRTGFSLEQRHLKAINNLKKKKNIIITRPDKGNGVVILDRKDYIEKMNPILSDKKKFERIGEAEKHDRTLLEERALQAFLLKAKKNKDLPDEVYNEIRPVGTARPRMYGVPKLHKDGVPLRPILSMVNSPHHPMAKWLATVLKPVVDLYSVHTVKDTFDFCKELEKFAETNKDQLANTFLCSFDIASLFTNIPLVETVEICLDALYRNELVKKPVVPEQLMKKMLLKATTEVEFSFNGILYKQIDGVAMGSPLGPVLANIFVGHCESRVSTDLFPLLYKRYVDDTFSAFSSERKANEFFELLNGMHDDLTFTMEREKDGLLPFLDVAITRTDTSLSRGVYRKPTFSGLYTRWDSFCDTRHKRNLIKSLTSRALRICTPDTIDKELATLLKIFEDNGYPLRIVKHETNKTIDKFKQTPPAKPPESDELESKASKPRTVTLTLPWKGRASGGFRREMERTVHESFRNVQLRTFFTTRKAFSGVVKDALPTTMKSDVIYHFTCHCECTYVGRTSQQLGERIKQHLPAKIFREPKPDLKLDKSDSAITRHLKKRPACIKDDLHSRFKILATARSDKHLEALEAAFINALKPDLCQQKVFGKLVSV